MKKLTIQSLTEKWLSAEKERAKNPSNKTIRNVVLARLALEYFTINKNLEKNRGETSCKK